MTTSPDETTGPAGGPPGNPPDTLLLWLPANIVTRLADGVRSRPSRDGLLLLAPDGLTAMMLTDEELAVLDGSAGPLAEELNEELEFNGMLRGSTPPPAEVGVRLTRAGIEFGGLDRLVDRLDRLSRRVRARHLLVVAVGLAVATAATLLTGRLVLAGSEAGLGPVPSALVLLVVALGLTVVHELGHGVMLSRFGGRLGRAGFGFHWGDASFYVDSTSALFLPKRQRIAQAAAGIAAELFVAAAALVAATVTDWHIARFVAGAALVHAVASAVLNAAPVLGLDGALIVSDLTDRPSMPTGSGRAVSRTSRWSRTLDLVVGLAAIVASTWLWAQLWWELVVPLWREGPVGVVVAGLAVGPTLAALLVGLLGLVQHRAGDRNTDVPLPDR